MRGLIIFVLLCSSASYFLGLLDPEWKAHEFSVSGPLEEKLSPSHPDVRPLKCQVLSRDIFGAEDFAFNGGWGFTGDVTGRIIRFNPNITFESEYKVLGNTNGRPLGMRFDNKGTLWIADAFTGLWSWSEQAGLVSKPFHIQGEDQRKPKLLDHIAIASDGNTLYVSDASHKYSLHHTVDDLYSGSGNGRVFKYNVQTGVAKVIAQDLHFANGIALSPDEASLLVSETAAMRITKLDLESGTRKVLANTHFVDNLYVSGKYVWAACTVERNSITEFLVENWWMRKLMRKVPLPPTKFAIAFAMDFDGNIVRVLHEKQDKVLQDISVVAPFGDYLYSGSWKKLPYVARCTKR